MFGQTSRGRFLASPATDLLQDTLLVILLGELGQLDEELIDLLDGQQALGCWRTGLALLEEDPDGLRNISLSPKTKPGCG